MQCDLLSKSNTSKNKLLKFYNIFSLKYISVPHLNEDEAKQALAQYVSEHCCYGKGPVKDLIFNTFESSNTHRV